MNISGVNFNHTMKVSVDGTVLRIATILAPFQVEDKSTFSKYKSFGIHASTSGNVVRNHIQLFQVRSVTCFRSSSHSFRSSDQVKRPVTHDGLAYARTVMLPTSCD